MDLYHQCAKRFEVQKIDGGYEPAGYEALLGTFVHRVLELVMQEEAGDRTIEAAKAHARVAWAETLAEADFQLLSLSDDQMREFRWRGWHSVENYFDMEDPNSVLVVDTEQYLKCVIEDVPMRGIIDRLDRDGDELVVSDYKNGKVPKPQYRGSKWEQLNFYAAMVEATTGERPVRGRLIFTAHSEVLETDFTDKSVGALVNKVTATWQDVKDDFEGRGFKTQTGPLCAWCPVMPTCPPGAAEVTMRMKKGRVREDAPGYAMIKQMQRQVDVVAAPQGVPTLIALTHHQPEDVGLLGVILDPAVAVVARWDQVVGVP